MRARNVLAVRPAVADALPAPNDAMLHDLRFACRTLRKSPGLAATALLTLAIGIGLNSSVFGIVNVLLFRIPAFHEPDRLVWVSSRSRQPGGPQGNLTYPDVEDLRAIGTFEAVVGYAEIPVAIGTGREAVRTTGQIVSGDLFGLLGVAPAPGRAFVDEEASRAAAPVAIIGDALWTRLFGRDPAVVGRAVTLNGRQFTIVGVAPPGFAGPDVFTHADVWVPMSVHRQVVPRMEHALERSSYWLRAVARLAPGIDLERAHARIAGVAAEANRRHPGWGLSLMVTPVAGVGPHDRRDIVPLSSLLLAVTLAVLLIACANVANLLLARAFTREREIGVRMALGGSRSRLVRQLLVESAVLAGLGSALGLLLAMWGTDLLLRFAQGTGGPIQMDTEPDRHVLAFTAALAVLTTFTFGLLPALRASGVALLPSLRNAARASTARVGSRTQRALVVAQLVISIVLLTGAGLLLRSLAEASRFDIGMATANRFTVAYDLELQGYSPERARVFDQTLLDRVQALDGVERATLAMAVPAAGRVHFTSVLPPDGSDSPDVQPEMVAYNEVWPAFFETMGIRLIRGRPFTRADLGTPSVAIVSETFARRHWPNAEPIGRHFRLAGTNERPLEVVAVARDVLVDEYTEGRQPFVYVPGGATPGERSLIVAAVGDVAGAITATLREVSRLDPNLATGRPTTFEQHLAGRLDAERALSRLLIVAGAIALLLAALGVYGVMAHAVASRVREIGVRVALGASRADVLGVFFRDSIRLVALGLSCGLPLAIAVSVFVRSTLVGVGTGDPLTLIAVSVILAGTMLVASYLPARRALAVDPAVVLRVE
jgi:predicted permease